MKKFGLVSLFCLFVISKLICSLFPSISRNELKLYQNVNTKGDVSNWMVNDINQDQADELIIIHKLWQGVDYVVEPVIIHDLSYNKIYTNLNYKSPVNGCNVLYDEDTKLNWLFLSNYTYQRVQLNGIKYIWKKNLEREQRSFEEIGRTDSLRNDPRYPFYGVLLPFLLQDIDNDGRKELVCTAGAGFQANPRGIFVFDFESGRLKWRFDVAGTVIDPIFEDFNLDGKPDFIFSTCALKNTTQTINGTTDYAAYLVVIDNTGKLLYVEKCFTGYGQVSLKSIDINNDGKNEIIRMDQTWGADLNTNSVSIIRSNGSKFVIEKKKDFDADLTRSCKLNITALDQSNKKYILVTNLKSGLTVLDENLEPVEQSVSGTFDSIHAIDDINNDSKKEILLLSDKNEFVILDHKFRVMAKIENPYKDDYSTTGYFIKTGAELPKRIGIISHNGISYYNYLPKKFFPYLWEVIRLYFSLLLALLILSNIITIIILIRKNKKERFIVDNMNNALIIVSRNKVLQMNPTTQRLLGINTKISDLDIRMLKDLQPNLIRELEFFLKSSFPNSTKQVEIKDSKIPYYQVTFCKLSRIPLRILIIINITDLGDYCNERIEWAETARGLAHHVRKHIMNIQAALALLEQNPEPEEQEKYREIIKNELDKIRVFTQAFQRMNEFGEYNLEDIDIVPWLEESISKFILPDNIRLIKDWTLKSLHASFDPYRFKEVVVNLMTNAVEAMPDGGILKVSLSGRTDPNGEYHVLLEVEDNGMGIPKENLPKIWTNFFTTKENGTGIGMPVVKKIVTSMQGEIDLVSEEGVGTTVSILLKGSKQ